MPTELASAIAAHWLGARVDSVQVVEGGATNLVYRVHAQGQLYYPRRYRKLQRAAVEREHALIAHCSARGVPAPLPLASAGATVLDAEDGACWALFQAAAGIHYDQLTVAQAHGAGMALARLHDATASASKAGFASWRLSWTVAPWVARLARIRAAIEQLPAPDAADRHALERVRRQAEWLADSACPQRYEPAYPGQLIHGDHHQANLFFQDDSVSAIIDWENTLVMPRAFELVRACFFICEMEPLRTRALVAGYREVSALTPHELADGAAAWGILADHHVWPLEETYLHGNPAARRFLWRRPFRPFTYEWAEADCP
jgi:homoserine kinase type II